MSRIARSPLVIRDGVEVKIGDEMIEISGSKGKLTFPRHGVVEIKNEDNTLYFSISKNLRKGKQTIQAWDLAGTTRSILNNMIIGVSEGYEKQLNLIGVGYRAKLQGKSVSLDLGYSHDVVYSLPDGVSAEVKSPTELIIKGIDKQAVGQVAKEIRNFRPPEPYKGKGVVYQGEEVYRKEVRKSAAKK